MRTTLALICILAVAAVSSAVPIIVGVALNVVDNGVPVHDGTPVPGYTQYLIYLVGDPGVGDDGALAAALNGGFTGPMSQVWIPGQYGPPPTKTPTLNTMGNLAQAAQYDPRVPYGAAMDSHINVFVETDPDAAKTNETGLAVPPPAEDKVPGGTGGHGIGTSLAGFEIAWLIPQANLLVAQIVVPDGGQVVFAGDGGFKYMAGSNAVYTQNPVSAVIGIPEPATLGLLAIGGIAALIRRRR